MRTPGRWKRDTDGNMMREAMGFRVVVRRLEKKQWSVTLTTEENDPTLDWNVGFSERAAMLEGMRMLREACAAIENAT